MIFLDQLTKEQINEKTPQNSQKAIVLIGVQGRGKTTLYNKMTNSNELSQSAGSSNTQRAFMKYSSYGKGFKVLDTPGFEVENNKVQHVAGLLAAITEGPLNRILIVLKLDHEDFLLKEFKKLLSTFQRFTQIITVVVTFWDFCEPGQEEKQKQTIKNKFNNIGINSFIFCSKNNSGAKLCSDIDEILENSPAEKVILSESEILLNLNFMPDEQDLVEELQNNSYQIIERFNVIGRTIRMFIERYPQEQKELFTNVSEDDKEPFSVNLMNSISEFAQTAAEDVVSQFEKKNRNLIDEISQGNQQMAFLIHFDLKKMLFEDLKDIQNKAQVKLNTQYGNSYYYLRKCVKCGLLWLVISGTTGALACRGIPVRDDLICAEMPQVQLKYENKALIVEVNTSYQAQKQYYNNQKQPEQKNIQSRIILQVLSEKFQIGQYGCGYIQDWTEMKHSPFQKIFNSGMLKHFIQEQIEQQKAVEIMGERFREKLLDEVQKMKSKLKD